MSTVSIRPDDAVFVNFLTGKLSPSGMEKVVAYLHAHPEVLVELTEKRGRNVVDRDLQTLAQTFPDQPQIQSLVVQFHASQAIATQTDAGIPSAEHGTEAGQGETDENPLAFLAPAQGPDELGRLGDYRILRKLGEGGMGMVFEAEDLKLKRRVAMKVMKPKIAEKSEHRQRFLREAQVAAQVEHDHICPIYQIGEENKVPFIAMPFLKGEPLNVRIKRERLFPLTEGVRIARELAEGLKAAHDANLIHRDIKPANIWLENVAGRASRVRILDFGLARLQTDEVHLTNSGTIVGTPAYMSPEQARAKALDGRTDLFSLGVVLYELVTGQRPFSGTDTISILTALAADDPTPPEKLNPQIPRELSRLILQLLAKNPDHRPANAQTVVTELKRIEMQLTMPIVEALPIAQANPNTANPWQDIDVEDESSQSNSIPMASIPETKPAPKKGSLKWVLIGLGLLFPLLLILGAVFYISTDNGTIEVQTTDKNVKIILEDAGGKITILDPQSKQQWVVNTGKYTIKLDDNPDGLEIDLPTDRIFEMKRGGKMVVSLRKTDKVIVGKDPKEKDKPTDPDRKAAEWVISVGGKVQINGEEKDITDAKLLPNPPYRLTMFRIDNQNIKDEDLKVLDQCTNIEKVIFSSTLLKGNGLKYLRNNKKIVAFDFYYNREHDPKLPNLKDIDFTYLEYLVFQGTELHPEALEIFKECTKIKAINLISTKLTSNGIKAFQKCINLEALSIHGLTDINDKEFSTLISGKSKLITLDIVSTNISDAGLVGLEGHTQLKNFSVGGTRISDKGLELLAKIPSLNQIRLDDTQITDKGLSYFENHKHISFVSLNNTKISDDGLKHFSKIEFWEGLHLDNTTISDKGLEYLKNIKTISGLSLVNTQITDKGLLKLGKINPQGLNLSGTKVTDEAISLLKTWTNLQTLNLKGTKITPAGIAELKKALPKCNIEHDEIPVGALEFDGKNSRVEIPTLKMDAKTYPSFTFEAWVKSDLNGNREIPNQKPVLVGTQGFGLLLHIQQTKDDRQIHHYQFEAKSAPGVGQAVAQHPDDYVHIAGVYDGERCHLYYQGKLLVSHKQEFKEPYAKTPIEIEIGRHFQGQIRAVRITNGGRYNKEFLPEKHLAADNATIALYLFADKEGDKVTDLSGKNHHGKRVDAKWISLAMDTDRKAAEWVLSVGGKVKINGDNTQFDKLTDLPKAEFRLTSIYVANETVSDNDFKILQGCKHIEEVIFNRLRIKGSAFQYLADSKGIKLFRYQNVPQLNEYDYSFLKNIEFSNLEILDFFSAPISDNSLVYFKDCKRIQELTLTSTKVTGKGLPLFSKCGNLEFLEARHLDISNEDLRVLSNWPRLKGLHLNATNVTGAAVEYIEKCPELRSLGIINASNTSITDDQLKRFEKLKHLEGFSFHASEVTDEGLKSLENFKLMELTLSGSKITDKGLESIGKNTELVTLYLANTKITDKGLKNLKQPRKWWILDLSGTNISDKGLQHFHPSFSGVLHLSNTNISDEAIPLLKTWTNAKAFYLKGTKITPAGIAELKKALPKCNIEHDVLPKK